MDPDNIEEGLARASGLIVDTPRDQPVVLYCSVGYRSAMLADKLLNRWKCGGMFLVKDDEIYPYIIYAGLVTNAFKITQGSQALLHSHSKL